MALLTSQLQPGALGAADADLLAEWVGDLPLALEVLAKSLVHGAYTPRELLRRMGDAPATLAVDNCLDVLRGQVNTAALRGVAETFVFSYQRLDNRRRLCA